MNSPCGLRAKFAHGLKHWRYNHPLTQNEMATKLGFCLSTVNAWETGERFPNGYALEHIAVEGLTYK